MPLYRLLLALLVWLALAGVAAAQSPMDLDRRAGVHDAWPHMTMLADPQGTLDLGQVLARTKDFTPGAGANLGRRSGAVWLRLPVQAMGSDGRWVLDIDYPPLDRIDVYLLDGQRLERQARLGDHIDWAQRALQTRSHALVLDLPPGQPRTVLMRLQTTGSMLAPVAFYTHERFEQRESREQALQGLLAGAGLILLLYSLAQWLMLRDAMFILYALTLLGTTAFFGALSGVGPQHVWGSFSWFSRNAPPFAILLGVCGAFFFALRALEVARYSPRVAWVVRICGALAGLTALAFAAGAVDYVTAQGVGLALGPAPMLLVLPTAFKRLREGDRAAVYLLLGWSFYSVGVLAIVGLLSGLLPVNFWSLHGFQFASLVEMGTWMLVLAERVQDIRRGVARLQMDRDRMHSLAHTDALTGLLNRRGLQEAMAPALAGCHPRSSLVLYLLDLDGFKPVNDTLGHDAGDELLVAVGQRLRAQLRASDLVCRLGGDEFVLVVPGISAEADARRLGEKVLKAFGEPFQVAGGTCRVGLTIGYALAPQDDRGLEGLLKRADAAMYAGKQAGKNRVQRGAAGAGLASQVPAA
ncbi:diguanylate cyclase (GGDEF) domain-containing protein [Burkholderiales bacterium JOSHI_001]|nr:diguanylate cyclase (GGDEF) domain-containing protein [Burkholderiales bacterium JOSHI_001]